MLSRVAALACWSFLVWVVLTWSASPEQLVFGAAVSLTVAAALAPLGPAAGPWSLLRPRALAGSARLLAGASWRIAVANARLARRIWDPARPLSSGMVITTTGERGDGGLAAVGVITSLIVDNQLVDIDRDRHELQYHAVAVPAGGPPEARAVINGPVEALLRPFQRARRKAAP